VTLPESEVAEDDAAEDEAATELDEGLPEGSAMVLKFGRFVILGG
jgi:hypothetical protein